MSETAKSVTASEASTSAGLRGEPSEIASPIFVVGCHRSGTTLLQMLLDSHPRISAGAEDPFLYCLSGLENDDWRKMLGRYGFSEDEWLERVRGLVEELHSRYAESLGKTRWAEKFPSNAKIIGFLDKLYPDCQVVHIVRNPRDVIASNRVMYGKAKGSFYGGRWVEHVRSAEVDGARLGSDRFRTIRYEDLVADPETVMKELIDWLGEPWSDDVLRFGERTHFYPPKLKTPEQKKKVVHTRSIGRGRSIDSLRPLLYVHLRARDLVRRFGY